MSCTFYFVKIIFPKRLKELKSRSGLLGAALSPLLIVTNILNTYKPHGFFEYKINEPEYDVSTYEIVTEFNEIEK